MYYLLSRVCGILVVYFHDVFFVCFQSGGGRREQGVAAAVEAAICDQEKYRAGEVALVGKIHVYSLSLLPLSEDVSV